MIRFIGLLLYVETWYNIYVRKKELERVFTVCLLLIKFITSRPYNVLTSPVIRIKEHFSIYMMMNSVCPIILRKYVRPTPTINLRFIINCFNEPPFCGLCILSYLQDFKTSKFYSYQQLLIHIKSIIFSITFSDWPLHGTAGIYTHTHTRHCDLQTKCKHLMTRALITCLHLRVNRQQLNE